MSLIVIVNGKEILRQAFGTVSGLSGSLIVRVHVGMFWKQLVVTCAAPGEAWTSEIRF